MNEKLRYAAADTFVPGPGWVAASDEERLSQVLQLHASSEARFRDSLVVVSAKSDGQVIVRLEQPVPVNERGALLLDFEALLKEKLDAGLNVWAEALGDKNSLRNLRGIEVKTL